MKGKKESEMLTVMYSNIQGITRKKESLMYIMEELKVDICLLAETLTKNVQLSGCRCFTPIKSVGQNVCIVISNKLVDNEIVKLHEPNEVVNLIGIRIEMLNTCIRVYTAHLKQQSVSSRVEITEQFEEIRRQFRDAMKSNECMLIIFDANVHVGDVIKGCADKQDWGGKEIMKLVNDENLTLLNSLDLCSGVITRVDPRNGKGSSIDLAICNQFFIDKVIKMKIDEEQDFIPTNFCAKVNKKTDHNTIILKVKIDKCPKKKPVPYYNLKDCEGKANFKTYLENIDLESYMKHNPGNDIQKELAVINELWSDAIRASFTKITPKRKVISGVNDVVRLLFKEEKWIRENVVDNPERGRRIAEVRKEISKEIEANRRYDIFEKVKQITTAKNPQGEIFKIRRQRKTVEKIGFPLKDKEGNIQVSKDGIDRVINCHFEKVFRQNPVPDGVFWEEYWNTVDEVFSILSNQPDLSYELPTFDEVKRIIWMTNDKKSVLGTMKNELIKLGGDPLIKLLHRFLVLCCESEDIPDGLRHEKMVLLYKNAGPLSELDYYRGIFIRYLLLSILQKWLYGKCSPVVDENGSELAFGGRTGRSVKEVLLILRLIQDYAEWSKQPLILKFLDITKFFDSMNYKKCLIEAFKSGIEGKYWKLYRNINRLKECTPVTPLGEGIPMDVEEVFLQGSSDAMIMAWNLVDSLNKNEGDFLDPVVIIDGIMIPRLLFVDDILEIVKSFDDLKISNIGNETFERANRVDFKPSKCKGICMNCEAEQSELDGVMLEMVNEHKYVGTIVSAKGRKSDLNKRVNDCKGVLNEVVEVCKISGVAEVRLAYAMTLISSCFKQKFKHGCEVWDELTQTETITVNRLIPDTFKRILEVPKSTPTCAVIHELGIIDLDLEIEMERILLANDVKNMDNNRVAKKLFESMYSKRIPGYCVRVEEALKTFGIDDFEYFQDISNCRDDLKGLLVEIQSKRLIEGMLKLSKTDMLLSNYDYDGKMKRYLSELSFHEARIVFLLRTRMFPTKENFPKRWSDSSLCAFCCEVETDRHLFSCSGYLDLHECKLDYQTFIRLNCGMEELSLGAKVLLQIHDRLLRTNEDSSLNGRESK